MSSAIGNNRLRGVPQSNSEHFRANSSRSLFFRDLPFSFNTKDLKDLIESRGFRVEDTHVVTNPSRKTMQYGYALFPTQDMAREAQQGLNNLRVHGRDIR